MSDGTEEPKSREHSSGDRETASEASDAQHFVPSLGQLAPGEPETDLFLGEMSVEAAGASSRAEVQEQTQGAVSRSFVLVGSKVATWGLAFVMTVMMPRYLGATGFGRLYLAMSLTGIMSILVEFGLNSLVAREVSRRREDATRYLVNAGAIKSSLWVVALAGLVVVLRIANYPMETQVATIILAMSVFSAGLSSLLMAILQADDRMRWIAISTVAEKAVYVGAGVTALVLGYGVLAIATVTLVGSVVGLLLDIWWFRRLGKQVDVRSGWQGLEIKNLFTRSLPFFSVLFFGAVYFRVDVVILSLMKSDAVVGQYGAAYRLFQTTYILPDAFLFALFPLFCRLWSQRGEALSLAAQKGLDLLLLVGIPIAAGMAMLSDQIISVLYGTAQYSQSVIVLRVLSAAIALMYANGVFVQLLIATERQKRLALTAGIAAVVNIAANFALIPQMGALGAATSTVITEAVVITLNFFFLPRALTRQLRFATLGKTVVSAAVMVVVLQLASGQSLLLLVPLGAVSYLASIVVLKAIPPEDWAMMKSALANLLTA